MTGEEEYAEDRIMGAKVDKDLRWLIGIIVTCAGVFGIPSVGFQWSQSTTIAVVSTKMENMEQSLSKVSDSTVKLTETLNTVIQNDMASIKQDIALLKARDERQFDVADDIKTLQRKLDSFMQGNEGGKP